MAEELGCLKVTELPAPMLKLVQSIATWPLDCCTVIEWPDSVIVAPPLAVPMTSTALSLPVPGPINALI